MASGGGEGEDLVRTSLASDRGKGCSNCQAVVAPPYSSCCRGPSPCAEPSSSNTERNRDRRSPRTLEANQSAIGEWTSRPSLLAGFRSTQSSRVGQSSLIVVVESLKSSWISSYQMVSAFNEIRSDRAASNWPSKLPHLPDSQPWNLRWVSRNRDRRSIRFIRGSSVSFKVFLGEPRAAPRLPVVLGIARRRSPPSGSPSVFTREPTFIAIPENMGRRGIG
ncbi:hypothetical protein EUGRSUZ_B00518 [Eucalyptus grandis]|uniref:Uncharacterized protein n=2 Tax=Eucalyptus grandis TaxID=71139 RepID=A0ACC3LMF5_EUCGR|nr:hypothetical protein EUGRSUZ_B00518 [Eucalyptus grandis]